jgi:preprotein translocase SecE subunit
MATALESAPTPATPAAPPPARSGLLAASLTGAVILLAGFALVNFAVPAIWDAALAPVLDKLGGFVNGFLRIAVFGAAIVGVVFAAKKLLPANPPRGTRGGIFLIISLVISLFFVVRAVGLNLDTAAPMGMIVFGIVAAALAFGTYKLVTSQRFANAAITIDDEKLLHTETFKKTQGLRTRRWTMAALLFLGLSGVYAMTSQNLLPQGDWLAAMPFLEKPVRLMSDVHFVLPLVLTFATGWFAWRAIHMPTFGDFLIGTDAEMNKVSWNSWKKLVQDTIVVLVTTVLLTLFLLVIDLFWGWLLTDVVRVLPQQKPSAVQAAQGSNSSW